MPGRRYGEFTEVLQAIHAQAGASTQETIAETRWRELRLVVAHDPERAQQQTRLRRERITAHDGGIEHRCILRGAKDSLAAWTPWTPWGAPRSSRHAKGSSPAGPHSSSCLGGRGDLAATLIVSRADASCFEPMGLSASFSPGSATG